MDMANSDTSSNDLSLGRMAMLLAPVVALTILGVLSIHVYGSHYYDVDYCQNVYKEWIAAGNDPSQLICDPIPPLYPIHGALFILEKLGMQF